MTVFTVRFTFNYFLSIEIDVHARAPDGAHSRLAERRAAAMLKEMGLWPKQLDLTLTQTIMHA